MNTINLPGITQPINLNDPIYPGSHFTWAEATKGGTRIPVSTVFEGETVAGAQITRNIISLAKKLDEIRSIFGDRPITVTSWYRPPSINRSVGGVANSQHLLGWAADIQIDGVSPAAVAAKLSKTWQGGLGDSQTFTHIDQRHLMGRSAARWDYGNA